MEIEGPRKPVAILPMNGMTLCLDSKARVCSSPEEPKREILLSPGNLALFHEIRALAPNGIMATGIENSDNIGQDGKRRNQLAEAGDFYSNYRVRMDAIKSLGINWMRFGEGFSFTNPEEGVYNLDLTEKVITYADQREINIIFDGLHFGVPNDLEGHYQNNRLPVRYAEYIKLIAKKFPSIKYYTPVNEPFVSTRFSTLEGFWNECKKDDDQAFARASVNIAQAAILAKKAVLEVWEEEGREGKPIFFQNDSLEVKIINENAPIHVREKATKFNDIYRFTPLDLIFGHRDEKIKEFLLANGITEEEYEWCMDNGNTDRTVFGVDHYPGCIHDVNAAGEERNRTATDPSMLYDVSLQYAERYNWPVIMHMEVNATPEDGQDIKLCDTTHDEVQRMVDEGVPWVGMSWFGDGQQIDWNDLCKVKTGKTHDVGLYTMNGHNNTNGNETDEPFDIVIKPIGKRFREVAEKGLIFQETPVLT